MSGPGPFIRYQYLEGSREGNIVEVQCSSAHERISRGMAAPLTQSDLDSYRSWCEQQGHDVPDLTPAVEIPAAGEEPEAQGEEEAEAEEAEPEEAEQEAEAEEAGDDEEPEEEDEEPEASLAGIDFASDEAAEYAEKLRDQASLDASHFDRVPPSGEGGAYTVKNVQQAAGMAPIEEDEGTAEEAEEETAQAVDNASYDVDATDTAIELADQAGIDLREYEGQGSGEDGRIWHSDVEEWAEEA